MMDSEQMRVIELLELSYQGIHEATGIPVRDIELLVWRTKRKAGARSTQELALMMKAFDTGERRDPARTPRQKLAASLGIKALTDSNVELASEYVRQHDEPLERDLISAYYFVDEPALWHDVSKRHGVHEVTAATKARKGAAKISRKLRAEHPNIFAPVRVNPTA